MLKTALASRTRLIILFAIIIIYGTIYFILSDNHPLHILSNICFHIGIFGLGYALILELLNRNYFKMFAYPIYYFVESRKVNNRRKHGIETENPLSPYEYEQKDLKKRKNTIFYIIGGIFIILSIVFAILFQPHLTQ